MLCTFCFPLYLSAQLCNTCFSVVFCDHIRNIRFRHDMSILETRASITHSFHLLSKRQNHFITSYMKRIHSNWHHNRPEPASNSLFRPVPILFVFLRILFRIYVTKTCHPHSQNMHFHDMIYSTEQKWVLIRLIDVLF